jgi:hypothetical protein
MGFYFVTNTILGALAGNSAILVRLRASFPSEVPQWMLTSNFYRVINVVAGWSAGLAILTTFLQWGFMWSLATLGEVLLGVLLVTFVPTTLRIILFILTIPLAVVILGAFWGFWYI